MSTPDQRRAYQRAYYALHKKREPGYYENRDAKHYAQNRDAEIQRVRRRQRELWELANSFKDVPCYDCGVQYPSCVMDFDHRVGEVKVKGVGSLIAAGSRTKLLLEIAKCDVVCANCHRMRTCKEFHVTHRA